mgnify:CR=1 FL=1
MVKMTNRRDPAIEDIGYLLVHVEDSPSDPVVIGCVIRTLCSPDLEYQLIDPTSQVALLSVYRANCTAGENITWQIYSGRVDPSSNVVQWTWFNQSDANDGEIRFFGKMICTAMTSQRIVFF